MNFNDFDKQNEVKMSPEAEKSHKSFFSKICVIILAYVLTSKLLPTFVLNEMDTIHPQLAQSESISQIINLVAYLIALPIIYFLIKPIPASFPSDKKLSPREFVSALGIASLVFIIGQYYSASILSAIALNLGVVSESTPSTIFTNATNLIILITATIVVAIIEEIVFRKWLIDRLRAYGERTSVFFGALIFALAQGNLEHLFSCFFIGIVLSYIYVKTGKLVYTIAIHLFTSLFFNVLANYLIAVIDVEELLLYSYEGSLPIEYVNENMVPLSLLLVYGLLFFVLVFAGIFSLNKQLYKIRFEKGKYIFPKGKSLEITFFNIGAIAFITFSIILIAISAFTIV